MGKNNRIPLVSVCCMTYNHDKFISQCLDGIIQQKGNFSIEILIHDDASSDHTRQIIEFYRDKYPDIIKPLYQEINQYSRGVNIWNTYMFPLVKGEYIAICDGDDYWIDQYKLEKQITFLQKYADYNLVYTNKIVINELGTRVIRNHPKYLSGNLFVNLLSGGNPITTSTVCIRTHDAFEIMDIVNSIPFRTVMGDLQLWLALAIKGKFKYLAFKSTVYRLSSISLSHSLSVNREIRFSKHEYFIKKYLVDIFQVNIDKNILERTYYKNTIRRLFSFRKEIFLSYVFKSVKKDPFLIFDIKIITLVGVKLLKSIL